MAEKDPWDFSEFGEGPASGSQRGIDPVRTPEGHRSRSATAAPTGFDDFGSGGLSDAPSDLTVARPPLRWLGISAGLSAVGLALAALLGGLPPLAIIGWSLSGPVAIGALAMFTSEDTRQRAHPVYVAPNWLQLAYFGALLLCLAGVIVSAIRIGLWVGRW